MHTLVVGIVRWGVGRAVERKHQLDGFQQTRRPPSLPD